MGNHNDAFWRKTVVAAAEAADKTEFREPKTKYCPMLLCGRGLERIMCNTGFIWLKGQCIKPHFSTLNVYFMNWRCTAWIDFLVRIRQHRISHAVIYTDSHKFTHIKKPASVAQLDARPTGDQEVAGRPPPPPPPKSATFFLGDWSWNIFYGHSLPSADSRRSVVSFWRKNAHNTG